MRELSSGARISNELNQKHRILQRVKILHDNARADL